MIRLGFVVPRYGEAILGGAETITRHLAEHLAPTEFHVEILTTCAIDTITWRNVYPPGLTQVNGVAVHRFPIDHHFSNERRRRELMVKFANQLPSTVDEEYEWIDNSAHSPELYAHIARQGRDFDLLIFGPYLFGTTFYGTTILPEMSVLWPHLHDEPFAHFQQTRLMMESCRGIMFNSEPEMALAKGKLGIQNPRAYVVGEGLDDCCQARSEDFRQHFGLQEPFVLYAGRLEDVKNLLTLLSYFIEYKQRQPGPLKLVLMGEGPLPIPTHPDIVPIGFQSEQDKRHVYAAATLLCQPSLQESFSLVIMEAWLAGIPVVVHGHCPVTRYHVLRCNGGLYFTSAAEFASALDWFQDHPIERQTMGALGRTYVRREFNWPTVLERFREAVLCWLT